VLHIGEVYKYKVRSWTEPTNLFHTNKFLIMFVRAAGILNQIFFESNHWFEEKSI